MLTDVLKYNISTKAIALIQLVGMKGHLLITDEVVQQLHCKTNRNVHDIIRRAPTMFSFERLSSHECDALNVDYKTRPPGIIRLSKQGKVLFSQLNKV